MDRREEGLYTQEELLTRLVRSGTNIYGYLIPQRRGIIPEDLARRCGIPTVVDNAAEKLIEYGLVAAESADAWRALFAAADRGEKYGSAMVSLKKQDDTTGRYWLRLDTLFDEEGRPSAAIITADDFTSVSRQVLSRENDINGLLQAAQKVFPELLTLNLTKGTYRMLQYDSATTLGTPREGPIDEMIRIRLGGVVPEDRDAFVSLFSREKLWEAFIQQGEESLQLTYRRPGRDGSLYWFESTVMRQDNALDDDVLLVAMSRNVGAQKAEETRLREQLRQQAEELRITMSQMGKIINYYDIATSTFTMPPANADENGIPSVMENFPESFIANSSNRLSTAAKVTIQEFYNAIRRGEPSGSCEYLIASTADKDVWMHLEFAAIFDAENRPVRAVVAAENVTSYHDQAAENRRLKENERVLQLLAQHSDRIVTFYDLETKKVRFQNEAEGGEDRARAAAFEAGFDLPENREKLDRLFREIRGGSPSGTEKLLFKNEQGQRRWLDLKYSTLFNEKKQPDTALFSFKDITEQYEHELAYLRQRQSMEASKTHLGAIEMDLETDIIEDQGGRMMLTGASAVGSTMTEFARRIVPLKMLEKDQADGLRFFSRKYLLEQYAEGHRQLERTWQMRFRDGNLGWVRTEAELMAAPYTNHIKAFFRMTDVTAELEARQAIQDRSERDGMTGLLNRATTEERIRRKVAEQGQPGILVLLDLDDLKSINDTFGHKEGDRAILGIAEALKAHFRESDIIGRIGGDEFLVYLSGAAENQEAIAFSIAALLRKLTGISIGGGNERRIHCSVGCAVQSSEAAAYEVLFKQADTALYHVKRSGKNNFAFYASEMEQEDYQFRAQKLFSMQSAKKFEFAELQYLLDAIAAFYPLVLSMNLSANDYYLMNEILGGVFSKLPVFGAMDQFVALTEELVHPDDVAAYHERLSRKALLKAYERGETSVRHYFRFNRHDGYHWTEAAVIFYTNEHGDVCDFTLVRWAEEQARELGQM